MRLNGDVLEELARLIEVLNKYDWENALVIQQGFVFADGERVGTVMWTGESQRYVFESD